MPGLFSVWHIVATLERMLHATSDRKICWIVDFNGFGFRHTDPRAGVALVQVLSAHYPERLSQVMLFDAPMAFRIMSSVLWPVMDEQQRSKVQFKTGAADREAFITEAGLTPDLAEWVRGVLTMDAAPGAFPGGDYPTGGTPPAHVEFKRPPVPDSARQGIVQGTMRAGAGTDHTGDDADAASAGGGGSAGASS